MFQIGDKVEILGLGVGEIKGTTWFPVWSCPIPPPHTLSWHTEWNLGFTLKGEVLSLDGRVDHNLTARVRPVKKVP